jgi:hypothetical protein
LVVAEVAMIARLHSRTPALFTVAALAAAAHANTYIVDAAGGTGSTFTDIPPAIAAVQPGDILLVEPGSYSPFTLDKGLVIVGYGAPTVSGAVSIQSIPATQRAALVGLQPQALAVQGCAGSVVVQSLGTLQSLSLDQCNDVRVSDLHVASSQAGARAIVVDASRLELVSSDAHGGVGDSTLPVPGASGLALLDASRAHVVSSLLYGGDGGFIHQQGVLAVDGGPGGSVDTLSELVTVGPNALFSGGYQGINTWDSGCQNDGVSGPGLLLNGTLFDSGTTFFGPAYLEYVICFSEPGVPIAGSGSQTQLAPPGPALRLVSGTPAPGAVVTIEIDGEPGAIATLRLARIPGLTPTPGVLIEDLLGPSRVIPLGAMPASGVLTRNLVVPASLTSGRTLFVQIDVLGSSGLQRTNSLPLILR